MKRLFFLGICTSITLLAACDFETVVHVDLPDHQTQLVVTSLFDADSLWRVHVGNTVSVVDRGSPTQLSNATVSLWANGTLLETLPYIGDGTYESTTRRPLPDETYAVHVAAPNYTNAEATATLPPAPRITEVRIDEAAINRQNEYDLVVPVHLTVEDPGQANNFYEVAVYQLIRYDDGQGGVHEQLALLAFESGDPTFTDDDFLDGDRQFYAEAAFRDDLFDGKTKTLVLNVHMYFPTDNQGVNMDSELFVAFSALSEDYYRFERTVELQDFTRDDPFAEPVEVHSNVSNGFGIFAGRITRVFPLHFDQDGR